MYFSFGNHVGFSAPIEPALDFEDYSIEILPEKERMRLTLTAEKQVAIDLPTMEKQQKFALDHELFDQDARIYCTKGETTILLKSKKDSKVLELSYKDFPYVGIWSPYPTYGNFVCIQPWCGIHDRVGTNQKLEEKLGIQMLEPGKLFSKEFSITVH